LDIKFKYYSIGINLEETVMLRKILSETYTVDLLTIDDWPVIDLLWRKHIVIYDKSREKKPEIQPWCKSTVLRSLSKEQSGA